MDVAETIRLANLLSVRVGAPILNPLSPRLDLVTWLATVDPNGSYTDADATAEGADPIGTPEAWDLIADMVNA